LDRTLRGHRPSRVLDVARASETRPRSESAWPSVDHEELPVEVHASRLRRLPCSPRARRSGSLSALTHRCARACSYKHHQTRRCAQTITHQRSDPDGAHGAGHDSGQKGIAHARTARPTSCRACTCRATSTSMSTGDWGNRYTRCLAASIPPRAWCPVTEVPCIGTARTPGQYRSGRVFAVLAPSERRPYSERPERMRAAAAAPTTAASSSWLASLTPRTDPKRERRRRRRSGPMPGMASSADRSVRFFLRPR
jgi:hypothetical protein